MDPAPTSPRELFDAEYAGLVRVGFLITGDRAAAEDAVQEAFARALARWKRVGNYERPGAWVRLVTVRLALRARDRRAELRHPLPERAAYDPEPADEELLSALRRLPPKQRAALVLFYVEGMSTAGIAEALRVPPSTARSHLHRGRAALAAELEPEEVTDGR
jgi:RNA polymerase sigma-70 factor (ECF subfamily)